MSASSGSMLFAFESSNSQHVKAWIFFFAEIKFVHCFLGTLRAFVNKQV